MYEGIYGMLHRNCGRGDHKGEPKPTGPGRPLAASPAAAAGDRFCGGGLLGDQRWGGSGAAHDLVIGGWAKVWYNNEEKSK